MNDRHKSREIFDLKDQENEMLREDRKLGVRICDYYLKKHLKKITPEVLDQVYELWMADKRALKPSKEDIIFGLGSVFGYYFVEIHGSKWHRVKDRFGEDMCVIDSVKGLAIYPFSFIFKRIDGGPLKGGFFRTVSNVLLGETYG